MGFFDWLNDKLSDAVDFVLDKINSGVDYMIDKLNEVGDFIEENILGTSKSLKNTSESSAEKVAKADSYDAETATIDRTQEINKLLDSIRNDYKVILKDKEEATIKYSNNIFNHISDKILKENENLKESINIDDIEDKFNRAIVDFKMSFSEDILSHITLSDYKCSDILKIEKSDIRKKEMENYLNNLVDEALDNFCKGIDNITNSSLQSINDNISRVLSGHENAIKTIKNNLEDNIKSKDDDIEEKRKKYEKEKKIIDNLLSSIN